jgi:hypothetical protein
MIRLRIVVALVLFATSAIGAPESDAFLQSRTGSQGDGRRFEGELFAHVWPALGHGSLAGRIYYVANCKPNDELSASFPNLRLLSPSSEQTGLSAVRDIFRKEKNVSVEESTPGIIRITIGNVPEALLRVRIPELHFTRAEQYNYLPAIFRIEFAPEVRSATQKLGVYAPPRTVNVPLVDPSEPLPHLPTTMTNVTVDQALDLVAVTFRGIVVYESCANLGRYDISLVDAANMSFSSGDQVRR